MAIKRNDTAKSRLWNAVNRANLGVPNEGAQRPATAKNALRNDRFRLESLEPRLLLSADPVFAAAANADLTVRLLQEDDITLVQILDNTADSEDSAVLQEYTLIDDTGATVLDSLTINGVDGSDESLTLENSLLDDTTGLVVNFNGGTGDDTVVGTSADTQWNLTGSGSGSADEGNLNFSGVANIEGGDGDDTVANGSVTASWSLTDTYSGSVNSVSFTGVENLTGAAGDTLDYSSYGIGVTVDLAGGYATGFASVTGFDNVTGSGHNDTIAGNSNANTLIGGGGDDTLVVSRDADITLTDTEVRFGTEAAGSGEDSISGFEAASLTGGDGANTIDASAFTGANGVSIDGGAGADILTGTANDDTIQGGTGNDTIDGLGGTGDTVVVTRDANITLEDTKITIDGSEEDAISNIETAQLTGGDSANTITASTFTKGGVTIDGGAGDDNITGSAQADILTGGLGADAIEGLGGVDTLVESSNGHFALVGTAASSTLTSSKNETALITLTGVTSGTFTLTFGGQTTSAIAYDASAAEIKAALRSLSNVGEQDVTVALGDMDASTDPVDGTTEWTISFTGDLADADVSDLTLDSSGLTDGTAAVVVTQYFTEDDTITNVEQAELTTGQGANILDASGFSGSVTLDAGSGDDILRGGSAADILKGGSGNDILSGGAGEDDIDGGTGNDILSEAGDRHFYLTSSAQIGRASCRERVYAPV